MRHPLGRVTTQNLLEGTVSDDHCRSNPCVRGYCNTTWNDFVCDCFEGYAGKQCEIRLRCADVRCPDKSACKNIGYTGFECVTDAAFDGKGYTTPHYILKSTVTPTDLSFSEISFRYDTVVSHLKSKVINDLLLKFISDPVRYEFIEFFILFFRYRSKRAGNVIHMSNGTSFLRISLEGNINGSSIVFHFMNNVKVSLFNVTIFDGEWHLVRIKFSSSEITDVNLSGQGVVELVYDKAEPKKESFAYHSSTYLKDMVLSPNLDIIVGSSLSIDDFGKPIYSDSDHGHSQHFRGCLGDIYVGNYRLPFISHSKLEEVNPTLANRSFIETTAPTAFYINERFHPSEEHLPRLGCTLCYEQDCQNGGQCTDPSLSYDCVSALIIITALIKYYCSKLIICMLDI